MRKIALSFLCLASLAWSATTYTTNAGIPKPADHDTDWGTTLRAAFDVIDSSFAIVGVDIPSLTSTNTFTGASNTFNNIILNGSILNINGSTVAYNSTANQNSFFGTQAGQGVIFGSGSGNTAMGFGALLQSGVTSNTAIGRAVLQFSSGTGNTGVGDQALNNNTTGVSNSALGVNALVYNTTGSYNIGIGDSAGIGTSISSAAVFGTKNIFIGYQTGVPSSNTILTNAIALGAGAIVGSSNTMQIGGTGPSGIRVNMSTMTASSATITALSSPDIHVVKWSSGTYFTSSATTNTAFTYSGLSSTITPSAIGTRVRVDFHTIITLTSPVLGAYGAVSVFRNKTTNLGDASFGLCAHVSESITTTPIVGCSGFVVDISSATSSTTYDLFFKSSNGGQSTTVQTGSVNTIMATELK